MVTTSIRVDATATGANGRWVTIRPGALQANWAGWVSPVTMKVWTPLYVNGVAQGVAQWVDTGYTSYPAPPVSFAQSSSYSSVTLTWSYPTGAGTPPKDYEVQKCNSDYTPYNETQITTGGTATFPVSQDTLYVFRVRSRTAAGLVSAWQDIRLGIGHPQQTATGWQRLSRSWRYDSSPSDAGMFVGLYSGVITGPRAPAYYKSAHGFDCGVVVEHTRYEVWTPYGWTNSWGLGRAMYWLGNDSADVNGTMSEMRVGLPYGPGWPADHPKRGMWSNGGCWGVWLGGGGGYDNKYGAYLPIYANINLAGTEYYEDSYSYVSVSEQANYTW